MNKKSNVIKLNTQSIKKKSYFDMDLAILLVICGIIVFGLVMVYSASYYYSLDEFGTPSHWFVRQVFWVSMGFVVMLFCYLVDYHFWLKFWKIAYGVGLFLLVLVLIPGIGTTTYGATRWIYIGPISLMPGEISKPCLILFITGYFTKHREWGSDFLKGTIVVVLAGGLYAGLILMQPNMSTAFTVIFIAAGMLIVAGIKLWQFVLCAGGGAAAGVALIFSSDYRRARFTSYMDPFKEDVRLNEGWNAVQSLLAIGTGGAFGKGLGNSVQKNLYLPMGHNDFILAIIGEELGFVGIAIIMGAYVFFFYRGFLVSIRAKDYEGMMLSFAITFWVAVQVVIHFAVVTSSMPPTGVVLPFISYGGNSILLFMGAIGILLNISKQNRE